VVRSADTLVELKAKLNGWTALISDFGLALEISEEEARNENIKRSSMAGTVVCLECWRIFQNTSLEHQTGTFLTLPPELVLVHPLHALDSYSYGATILWLLMRVYPKPTAVLVPSVNSFVEKLIGSDSCSRHSSRLVDMSEPNLIGSFVSVRGEFRRMEVVEVLSSGVRLYVCSRMLERISIISLFHVT
jgi:serine/threonine protein kinase